jgi:hypothetical protein
MSHTDIGLRGTQGTPDVPRMSPVRCPACGRPFAEGVFGAGTTLLVRCANRHCVAHHKERMIVVYSTED